MSGVAFIDKGTTTSIMTRGGDGDLDPGDLVVRV
jgi:hypothetical protein